MANEKSIINMYLKEINKIPLLTREEELDLAIKAKNGDSAAKNKIVNSNLRFVIQVAKKFQNRGLELEDLISEGNIGLLMAIDKFEPSRGYHFISYAVWWIRQSILKAVSEKSRAIRLPLNKANELVRIEHARKAVAGKKSEQQEFEEIAQMLNMDAGKVREMINISRDMLSLDAELSTSDDGHSSIGDYQEDTINKRPEEIAIDNSLNDEINTVLETLQPNEAKVLRMRYGLNGLKPMSLQEIGDNCNLTKERIRQIEKHAIYRLQQPSRVKRLAVYVA